MDVKIELKKFLLSEVAMDLDAGMQSLGLDEDLISRGIIDSLGILKLAAFIEERFGIKMTDEDIIPENFRTLNCLEKMIESKHKNEG